jgi:hypothetical protein
MSFVGTAGNNYGENRPHAKLRGPRFRLTLESLTAPGRSMVCRIGRGGRLGEADASVAPPSFWCAYYGAHVLENGWEPFDQPGPAAYMPCRLAEFEVKPAGPGGALLVQREARVSRATLRRAHPGLVATSLAGISPADVAHAVRSMLAAFELDADDLDELVEKVRLRSEVLVEPAVAA